MCQVDIDSYEWDTTGETDDKNYHKSSLPMESGTMKASRTMKTQYSSSSRESSFSDDSSPPSVDSNEESAEQRQPIDKTKENFFNYNLDLTFARRKVSTSSITSSTDSTCHSVDGVGSESELTSTCYRDFETVPTAIKSKYNDIIDKIVKLRFSENNLNADIQDDSVNTVKTNDVITDNFVKSVVDKSNKKEDKSVENKTRIAKNNEVDDVNGNHEIDRKNNEVNHRDERSIDDNDTAGEESDGDDDLVERGPVRPNSISQSHHGKPYYTLDWLAGNSSNNAANHSYTSDYDTSAEEILRNKQFSEKLNPCLDQLSDYGQSDGGYDSTGKQSVYDNSNVINGWSSPEANCAETSTPSSNVSVDDAINAPIPSIILNDPGEASLLEILANGGFQAAQALSDTASMQHQSPGTASSENWPDSPASSYNVLSSRTHSRASSRAQSPGSGANVGSPLLHLNMLGSPVDWQSNAQNFRAAQPLSSSESSNHSFSDTPSPSSYHCGVDHQTEEQLGLDFGSFSTWCQSCVSTSTIVNSAETIDAIDTNELQLVEEVIRGDQSEKQIARVEEMQIVPKLQSQRGNYENEVNCTYRKNDDDLVPNLSEIRRGYTQRRTLDNVFNDTIAKPQGRQDSKFMSPRTIPTSINDHQHSNMTRNIGISPIGNSDMVSNNETNQLVCPDLDDVYNLAYSDDMQSNNIYNHNPLNSTESLMDFENSLENFLLSHYAPSTGVIDNSRTNGPSTVTEASMNSEINRLNDFTQINGRQGSGIDNGVRKPEGETSKPSFNDFQIPETVTSYRQNRPKKTSERIIAPWPSLNLPRTGASERLKAGLDPREVQKAMINLLKKPTEDLVTADEDGDTLLMCLVGNPLELEKKKAYLAPLVERLGNVTGALTMTNNRCEDALYLAAMNCPQMAYVTGYLAAAMLQRGIDVSQRLYHTRGDTLIHAIADRGDTHGAVLAELLSLRTVQGNPVFDLSKRNYDGRTPLHVAVESHDPAGSGVNSIGTIRLLLENGANPKIKEPKSGDTALHMATSLSCDPALVKALLSNKGHEVVNIPNYNNNTPVHMAAALSKSVPIDRQMSVCMHLMQAGGATNVQNRQGKTPLALVSTERKETIRNIFHKKA